MKLPICSFDAKAGILCPKCEARLKAGHLTKAEVELSIKLNKMSEKIPELDKATLLHAWEVNGDYVLALSAGDLATLRKDPKTILRLQEGLGRRIWLVEGEASDRKMLEDLFYPVRILTVNIVWLPDGSKLTKVIIPGRRTERFPLDIEQVKRAIRAVRGIELLVEFERQ